MAGNKNVIVSKDNKENLKEYHTCHHSDKAVVAENAFYSHKCDIPYHPSCVKQSGLATSK